jgi:hypothetical protein
MSGYRQAEHQNDEEEDTEDVKHDTGDVGARGREIGEAEQCRNQDTTSMMSAHFNSDNDQPSCSIVQSYGANAGRISLGIGAALLS